MVTAQNKKTFDNFFAEKEQELFTQEIAILKDKYNGVNWSIDKDFCNKILGFDKPPVSIVHLCETFMHVLDHEDRSWNNFKVIL
jgi:hypothetical protein